MTANGRAQVLEYTDGTYRIEVDGAPHANVFANVNVAINVAMTLAGKPEPRKLKLVWDSQTS